MEVAFFRNSRWKKLCTPRSMLLSKNALVKLSDSGFPVSSENAEGIVRYLSVYEAANAKVIPFTRSIDRIGWIGSEFFPYVTESAIVNECEDTETISKAIAECGSFDIWLSNAARVRKNIFGRAIMAAAFASPLLEPLKHRVIIVHIWYASRSGKTAVLKFALSIYGDPMKLMGNFNSTAVGLERKAGILKNLPLGLDELQVLNAKRLSATNIVYSLGNGYGKTRGSKNGGLQDVPTWRSCIICTGEQSLSSESAMDGVNTRVLEFYGAPTDSVEFGRALHLASEQNYGFAGKRYIKYLIRDVLSGDGKHSVHDLSVD